MSQVNQMIMASAGRGSYPTKIYSYTGADQTYTVPFGVTKLLIRMWGAGGGGPTSGVGRGGAGGYVTGLLTVTPGQVLTIMVGEGGASHMVAQPIGSSYGDGGGGCGSQGGGRSAIRVGGADIVTAGGGGGSGPSYSSGNGGAGGGLSGSAGTVGGYYATGGQGGTQSAGGAGGTGEPAGHGSNPGQPGTQHAGGTNNPDDAGNGGGGGGGWWGGGGAAYYGGGGGGSSYLGSMGSALTEGGSGAAPERSPTLPPLMPARSPPWPPTVTMPWPGRVIFLKPERRSPMRPKPRMLLPLACCLSLAASLPACAPGPVPVATVTKVERVIPPADLLSCAPDPAPPAAVADVPQSADAGYMLDLWSAWADCSAKLGRVRAFVSPP